MKNKCGYLGCLKKAKKSFWIKSEAHINYCKEHYKIVRVK